MKGWFYIDTIDLTAKVQIYPTENQKKKLIKSMEVYKEACNFLSKKVFEEKDSIYLAKWVLQL